MLTHAANNETVRLEEICRNEGREIYTYQDRVPWPVGFFDEVQKERLFSIMAQPQLNSNLRSVTPNESFCRRMLTGHRRVLSIVMYSATRHIPRFLHIEERFSTPRPWPL